jgi:hypothetical protein
MNKNLSWKILIPLGLVIWILGKAFSDSTLGSAGAVLGLIILVLGIVAAVRAYINRNKTPQQPL